MKKVFCLFMVVSLFTFYACNNDESVVGPLMDQTVEITPAGPFSVYLPSVYTPPVDFPPFNESEAVVIDSEEKFFSMFPKSTIIPLKAENSGGKRGTVYTAYGFDSYVSTGNVLTYLTSTTADLYGVPPGYYYIEYMLAQVFLAIMPGQRFIPIFGSEGTNGWLPSGGSQCGYSAGGSGIKYYLDTRVSVLRYTASGQQIEVWRPCTMSNLWWKYEVE